MRGGKRKGAGRKSKSNEAKLIQRLDAIIDQDNALQSLADLIDKGNLQAIKLYCQYRYGLPREKMEVEVQETKILILGSPDIDENEELLQ